MGIDRAALQALAESVGDGAPIAWDAIEAQAAEEERRIIRQLRVLDNLAQLHRSLPTVDGEDGFTAPRDRPLGAPAIGNWGHLALVERLGGGAYGEVYRAWDRQLEREVALKVLRSDRGEPRRLLAEARLLARVRHQNVVSVHGVDTHEGRIGLWMELVRGVTLEQLIETQGPFSAREAALVGVDLCHALAAIHAAGLVHRDVKAQNVMREDGGRLVLMDLGTGRDAARGDVTGGVAGTPLYIAPEIFGDAPASERTDIYSLGVLLYHLVTGEYPVRAASFEDLQKAHASGRAIRLRDERPDLPAAFVAAVDRALSPDPTARYQTAGALEADLLKALHPATPAPAVRRPRLGWRALSVLMVLLGAAAAGIYWWQPWRNSVAAAPTNIRSIAVLPLRNDSGDPAHEYFADGMTDELISMLGRLPGLTVMSRTSSMQFKGMQFDGAPASLPDIAKRLGADAIVEGSVLVIPGRNDADPRVRISARLIAAGTDTQIWNQTFETVAHDVIALEGQVARAIAEGIRLKLSARTEATLRASTAQQPPDFEAFNLYLRGRYYLNLRTKADIERSVQYFQEAATRDPNYAAPHAGLADAYVLSIVYGSMPYEQALTRARDEAARALQLDDTIVEAHLSLAVIHDERLEWEAAEAEFHRALEINPAYATAHHWHAAHHVKHAEFDEAKAEIERAIVLDPLSPTVRVQRAAILRMAGEGEAAKAQLQEVLATWPSYARAHYQMAQVLSFLGDNEGALAEAQRTAALGAETAELSGLIGCILARMGRTEEAESIAEALTTRYEETGEGGMVSIADIYASLGQTERAFQALERAHQDRDPIIGYLKVDQWVTSLHSDPRFDSLLARLGLTR